MSSETYRQIAADMKLDTGAFGQCFDSRKFRETVERDLRQGSEMGVNSTPAFFINGRFLSGAQPFEAFRVIIEDELK